MTLTIRMTYSNTLQNTIKSKLISFIRFYKIKMQNLNAITEQNIENLAKEAKKLKEVVQKELEQMKRGTGSV